MADKIRLGIGDHVVELIGRILLQCGRTGKHLEGGRVSKSFGSAPGDGTFRSGMQCPDAEPSVEVVLESFERLISVHRRGRLRLRGCAYGRGATPGASG